MANFIESETAQRITTIRINRPDKKNALTDEMYYGLADALRAANADPATRVIVLTGTGDSYTAGNDIGSFVAQSNASKEDNARKPDGRDRHPVPDLLDALISVDKPTIAAVNGLAIGIGTTMLFHIDLVYASESARFAMPFVNLGVVPEAGTSLLLPRAVGRQRAAELFLFGDQFGPETAHECGFVNAILPADRLMPHVLEVAGKLAQKAPGAIRETKKLMRQHSPELDAAMHHEARVFAAQLRTPESKEAMRAFAERRAPDFSAFE